MNILYLPQRGLRGLKTAEKYNLKIAQKSQLLSCVTIMTNVVQLIEIFSNRERESIPKGHANSCENIHTTLRQSQLGFGTNFTYKDPS